MDTQKLLSGLIVFGCAIGVGLKLWTVPITHDEAWTIMRYVPEDILSIIMYPDTWPNNHILNTLASKCTTGLFGWKDWAARLPNFLSFFLYAWAAFMIGRLAFGRAVWSVVFLLVLFMANPYLLDFFSLCRGYGLSLAFLLLSLYFFIRGFNEEQDRWIFWAVVCSMLSAYANFTSLVFWAASMMLAGLYFWIYSSKKLNGILVLALGGLGYLGLIIGPILKMRSADQFKFWSSNGFYEDTIVSSVEAWRYGAKLFIGIEDSTLSIFVAVGFIAMLFFAMMRYYRSTDRKQLMKGPFFVIFVLMVVTVAVNLIQCMLLKTPYLSGRTALLYYPLYMGSMGLFLVASGRRLVGKSWVRKGIAGLVILLCLVHLVDRYKKHTVREWWYDSSNKEVINYLAAKGEDVTLATSWIFHPSFDYYTWSGQADHIRVLPYNKKIVPEQGADFYYIEKKELKYLDSLYEVEKMFTINRFLMRRVKTD